MIARASACVLGLAIALLGCSRGADAPDASTSAQHDVASAHAAAPEFALPDLQGNTVTLASLRGKTVILDFWATWCPPCEFQLPVLSALSEAHRGDSVAVIGISVDVEGPDVVRSYLEKHPVSYTILMGSEALARDFGAQGFPSLVVIGPDGAIHSRHVGLIEREELEQILADAKSGASGA